jgi:stage III sporulation protein AG
MKMTNEAKNKFNFHEVWTYFQKKPVSIWLLLGLIGFGVILLTGGNPRQDYAKDFTGRPQVETGDLLPNTESDEERLEKELTETLMKISGVGEVRVDINLKAGNRKIWERQTRTSKRVNQDQGVVNTEESVNDELVFAKDREGRDLPVLKEELAPEIEGVVVVATGASDSYLRKLLTDTVTTILGLSGHRVLVIPGK